MYKFSNNSKRELETCHLILQYIFEQVLKYGLIDIAVIQGVRTRSEQNRLFDIGKSRVQWPNSRHNIKKLGDKSNAVDVAPCIFGKVSWKKEHCIYVAGVAQGVGRSIGVDLRWGGNWDMDGEPVTDQAFQDLVHYELAGEKK